MIAIIAAELPNLPFHFKIIVDHGSNILLYFINKILLILFRSEKLSLIANA